MIKIYSKIKPNTLLHIVGRKHEIGKRCDMCPPEEFLQVASFELYKGQTFKPHKHVKKLVAHDVTQESWVVIQGSVEAVLYDLDDTVLERLELKSGDYSITFRAGHTYRCLKDDTLVLEFKTGPYLGVEKDKTFIWNK